MGAPRSVVTPDRHTRSPATILSDEATARIRRAVALKIGGWLEESGMLSLPVRTLKLWQLEAIGDEAVAAFIIACQSERARGEELPAHLLWTAGG